MLRFQLERLDSAQNYSIGKWKRFGQITNVAVVKFSWLYIESNRFIRVRMGNVALGCLPLTEQSGVLVNEPIEKVLCKIQIRE